MILRRQSKKNFMSKHLEIEIRGPLKYGDEKKILGLENLLKKNQNKQLVVFIKQLEKQDFRIKCNQSVPYIEFIQKKKKYDSYHTHDEISFKIKKEEFQNFLKILSCFGIDKGFYSSSERIDLFFEDIIFSIKKGAVIGDYWEAEASDKLLSKIKIKNRVLKYLYDKVNSLGLYVWTEKEFKEHKNSSWNNIKAKPLSIICQKYLK